MALPDTDKITQELNKRFAAPLLEFYDRRIIFWYDEDREFEDKLDEIVLDNAKLLILTGSNSFAAKKLLAADDTAENYLVYCPLQYEKPEDDWLINIKLYSEEFRADLNSIRIDEMGLPNTPAVRQIVRRYRKFFNSMERRKAVSSLRKDIGTASQLHLAVLASICGISDIRPSAIIRAVLEQELDNETIYSDMVKYDAAVPFRAMLSQLTGYPGEEEFELGRLATHILLTAATRTMRPELMAGLESFISVPHQSYCYDIISDWLSSGDKEQLYRLARYVEAETALSRRFDGLKLEDLIDTECFPCIDECILKHMMKAIGDYIIDSETIGAVVEKRRTMAWYDRFSCYYDGLAEVANMQLFFRDHASGFHLAQAREIWDAYTTDYYMMDTYYRRFHLCFGRSLTVANEELDDLFKAVVEKAEGLYNGWFLDKLGSNWSDICADDIAQYGIIPGIAQQEQFYNTYVAARESKAYVIISDALRYEVAAELAEQLRRETQSKVKLSGIQGIFPTITKFGMAALLPHKKLNVVQKPGGGVAVLADGSPTEMPDRGNVLKSAHTASVALQYKNIIKLKRAERQALVKGMDVVYIYHDKIDEASHTADNLVFPACNDAITEIKNIVRMICNDFGGTRILITADHGFLYTYSPLTEDDKVDTAGFKQKEIEYGRRYAIMEQDAAPEYLMPVKFMDTGSGFTAFAPRENIRIKMSGGGLNFVHGGISLQELVVPVIDYRFLRKDSSIYRYNRDKYDTKPVTVSLLSASRKICNMIFSLSFYQTEPVSDNRSACNYSLYFTDAVGEQISDIVRIIADKTSDNAQERTFRCSFNLKSMKYSNQESYYLVIADESGQQAPQREEFQIDIALAVDEFNFF